MKNNHCGFFLLSTVPVAVGLMGFCRGALAQEQPLSSSSGKVSDPICALYDAYTPDFVDMIKRLSGYGGALQAYSVPDEMMKLSTEKAFFTLNRISESDRANALVEAGIKKEQEGRPNEAIEIYQKVIDEYPDSLYRVSRYGIFVPTAYYCQLRILGFPSDALNFYRTKYDSRARESYELARQRHSLEGLAEIRDTCLATSYGAPSLMALGYSALDKGHFLEALEYLQTVWDFFPVLRTQSPDLSLSMTFARKMLGQGVQFGERYGLVGYWKFDEGKGTTTADASGYGNEGRLVQSPLWVPGKTGTALRFSWTNSVEVRPSTFCDIGTGGAGFSVSLWVNLERATPHTDHAIFGKYGAGANEYLAFGVMSGGGHVGYALATEHPTWETDQSKTPVSLNQWTHIALVKTPAPNEEVRIYVNGRLDKTGRLKERALKNAGRVVVGRHMYGAVDEVRLYNRPLLDREVAALAGSLGAVKPIIKPATGEAPLTVECSVDSADSKADCFWEFGDGDTERGRSVRHTYGLGGDYTVTVTVTDSAGAISSGTGTVSVRWRPKDEELARRMTQVLNTAKPEPTRETAAPASRDAVYADDYTPMPPSMDPMALQEPVWREELPGSRNDQTVFTQPAVTRRAVIYRHKNIVYCRSILNGELLWANSLGGRVNWQSRAERQYPLEGVLVQDGLVFTCMYKVGPSLVALDEVTGQLKWAYGPMVASTEEEARMRFEATPAGGGGAVYATYILDNIEGDAHTDSEYGVIAFEAATGRVRWRREICRLQPGQFAAGFAERRRNRIRSFASPPLYHEGTVYACTDAGAIAALDALSGRIKWLTRYPYWPAVHDATRGFGALPEWSGTVFTHGMHEPSFWLNQRPWIVGERLFVLPVDSTMMHCVDRRTGKIEWSWVKSGGNYTYVLGPTSEGYLVIATSGRGGIVHLLDPTSGKVVWTSPDPILAEDHPVMTLSHDPYGSAVPGGFNNRGFFLMARPFLTSDDRLYTTYFIDCGFTISPWCTSMAEIALRERKVLNRRRYYLPAYQAFIADCIARAGQRLKELQELPHKDERLLDQIRGMEAISKDTVPQNTHGPFLPFSRITFERFGVPFELRFSTRTIEMLYDREAVKRSLAGRDDPEGLFARAELALSEVRLKETADLMRRALSAAPPEDLDFRAAVNQQLYLVYKRLARSSVRSGQKDAQLACCLGMSQSVGSLADEMETLMALSEVYERRGDYRTAARMVQHMIYTYGQHEYEMPSLLLGERDTLMALSQGILDRGATYLTDSLYGAEAARAATLAKQMLALYFSALSPLRKDLSVRAGELGAQRLLALRAASRELAAELDREAAEVLTSQNPTEQVLRLWEFPGTMAAQKVLDDLLAACETRRRSADLSLEEAAELRKREWALADAARVAGLKLPEVARKRLLAPPDPGPPAPIQLPLRERSLSLEEERGPAWLVLERHGCMDLLPDCIFMGGRVKKKLDNKFLLYCVDLAGGGVRWKAQEKRGEQWFDEIRLGEKGAEPGFFETFVHDEVVVSHGMNDVVAFEAKDGSLRWRYTTPYGFEIKHSVMSGDLLILVGQSETIALYLGTRDPRGEVAWQVKEEGIPYSEPYFVGDRLVSLRKMPSNLTVRYRSTGKLIGRLALPDLTLFDEHPLIENGPRALPLAHDGSNLVVTDGWYYLMLDVDKLRIVWKRLIDQNDATRLPPMRFAMKGNYLAVVKQDYDVKTIYMIDSRSGEVLWKTDPKVPDSPQPLDTMLIVGEKLYGIRLHPGQGFYFAGVDCRTGRNLFPMNEQKGYAGRPEAALLPGLYGNVAVVRVRDRQDFELKAFDVENGTLVHTIRVQGTGDFGEHGRVSATVNNGKLVLLGQNDLKWAGNQ